MKKTFVDEGIIDSHFKYLLRTIMTANIDRQITKEAHRERFYRWFNDRINKEEEESSEKWLVQIKKEKYDMICNILKLKDEIGDKTLSKENLAVIYTAAKKLYPRVLKAATCEKYVTRYSIHTSTNDDNIQEIRLCKNLAKINQPPEWRTILRYDKVFDWLYHNHIAVSGKCESSKQLKQHVVQDQVVVGEPICRAFIQGCFRCQRSFYDRFHITQLENGIQTTRIADPGNERGVNDSASVPHAEIEWREDEEETDVAVEPPVVDPPQIEEQVVVEQPTVVDLPIATVSTQALPTNEMSMNDELLIEIVPNNPIFIPIIAENDNVEEDDEEEEEGEEGVPLPPPTTGKRKGNVAEKTPAKKGSKAAREDAQIAAEKAARKAAVGTKRKVVKKRGRPAKDKSGSPAY